MALNANLLGEKLYTTANRFNDVDITDIETARRDFWKGIATEIIAHFKEQGVLNVPGLGLIAGNVAVTGNSITGKLE